MTTHETRSERFRRRISETYEGLSPADEETVTEVAVTLDLLDSLDREISAAPSLVEVRAGGPRMIPAVVERRLQSDALRRLLARFPDLDEADE